MEHLRSLDLGVDMAMAMDAKEAQRICGIEQSGVWLSRGAGLNLYEASKQLLKNHDQLTCVWNTHITRLEKGAKAWHLFDAKNKMVVSADKVVIACAMDAKPLMSSLDVFACL
jgi:tRNA 5-methylaminomethyl-2-thiouridine biosynthesis bifunctional protein